MRVTKGEKKKSCGGTAAYGERDSAAYGERETAAYGEREATAYGERDSTAYGEGGREERHACVSSPSRSYG